MLKNIFKNIVINSTILFVIAAIAETIMHESGHFIAGILVHAKEVTLFHNYVSDNADNLSLSESIFIKGAGPFVSLFIGVLFHFICSRQKERGLTFLFNLYMSVFGYIGMLGYLMIAPIFTYGDTGYICKALNFPLWLTVTLALAGAFLLYLLMRILVRYFVEMATKEIAETKELRSHFIASLVFYPVLLGIVISTLLNLPVPTFASLIAPICSPFTILWTYRNALSQKYPGDKMSMDITSVNKINYKWVIVFVLTIVVNRYLVTGFSIR